MSAARPLALITGGWHRIGAAIATTLAQAGYDLALHRHRDGPADAAFTAELERHGAHWQGFTQELADDDAADRLFDAASSHFGRAPALIVNNASLFRDGDVMALSAEQLSRHLAVNLTTPTLLARRMGAHGGAIVNILDQRVRQPVPDQIAYSLSKQALWQATRTLAVALAPAVRVNAVAPGLSLPTEEYEPGRMERMAGLMPLERLPAPAEIADAVLYLARAESVTGQTIFVDGGANLTSYPRDFAYL